MDSDIPMKRCTKCGIEYPATTEYFHRHKRNKDGFHIYCKSCRKLYPQNPEYYARYRERYADKIRECRNVDRINEYHRIYYQQHKEEIRAYYRARRANRDEGLISAKRKWLQSNPGKIRQYNQAYRTRKLALPCTWTKDHWLESIRYWHHCCAVCGKQLRDLFGDVEPHADHWIAITDTRLDNPGTVPENMICLCNTCNLSKHDKDPVEWLNQRYGKRKAAQILKRIQAYFDWIKSQP